MPAMQLRSTFQPVQRDSRPPTMDGHLWIPIDDTCTWVYNFTYSYFPDAPLTEDYALLLETEQGRGPDEVTPDFRLKRNRSNDYLIDRQLQKSGGSFTGIKGINTEDFALQENMAPVVDRTKEHLGTIDQPIIVGRQLLLEATHDVAEGRAPRGSDPRTQTLRATDDFVPAGEDWQEALKERVRALY